MKQIHWPVILVMFLWGAGEGHAQIAFGGAGGGGRGRTTVSVISPIAYVSPYRGSLYRRVTVFYVAPSVATTSLPLDSPSTAPIDRGIPDEDRIVIMPRPRKPEEAPPPKPEPAPEPAAKPLPGVPASVFRPVKPEDRARALQPVAPEPPPPPPLPRPPDQPLSEPARLIGLAKEAFAEGAYGLAERRFRQVTTAAPDEALAYFLLAQAQFAQGKYQEAVASIQVGLRRHPDWPRTRFRPRDLYGAEAADFPEQLRHLTDTLPRHPKDPVVLFLLAYQLWLDGQQVEARKLFERAAAVTPDRTLIDCFLQ